jgi:two-component system NarL family response regulator
MLGHQLALIMVSDTMSLMLVDDHALVRMGLVSLLQMAPDFRVVAESDNGPEAVELLLQHRPDVTLLDIRLPRVSGIETLQQMLLRWPEARVVMLTTSDLDEDIERAFELGAAGYLLKRISYPELARAVRQVHAGESYIPESIARQLAASRAGPHLSAREREVLALLPKGLSNPDIARVLGISLSTVKTHLRTIFSKLDVADRAESITVAVQRGLLRLEE